MKFGNMTQGLNTSSLLPCKYYSFTRIDSIAEKLSELILFSVIINKTMLVFVVLLIIIL